MNKLYTTLLAGLLLVGVACAGNAATFSFNFFETDAIPAAYSYSNGGSGTNYTLSGSTSEINIVFAGSGFTSADLGFGLLPSTKYSAILTVSATESEGSANHSTEPLDSLTATFSHINGTAATFTVTAGTPPFTGASAGNAGVLSGQNSLSSGGFAGSNVSGTAPDNVHFGGTAILNPPLSLFTLQNYSFTLTLPAGTNFTYTNRPFPSLVSDLGDFTTSLTGGGVATFPGTTPEPGTLALAVSGLVSFSALRLRRRK